MAQAELGHTITLAKSSYLLFPHPRAVAGQAEGYIKKMIPGHSIAAANPI